MYAPVLSCSNQYGDAISVSAGGMSSVGVRAIATAEDGDTCGIYAESASVHGNAVLAIATSDAGDACGVYGMSVAEEGSGVRGRCGNTGGEGNGQGRDNQGGK